jgi:hypothetical protein
MSFPEGPPSEAPQQYATDGRDADGTSLTASAEDSTTMALSAEDPSVGAIAPTAPADAVSPDEQDAADLDQADRDQTDQDDDSDKRASTPGGALGPGTTATGAGTSLD